VIHLIGQRTAPDVAASALRAECPSGPIITTDFVVSGEEGAPLVTPGGLLLGFSYARGGRLIISIDHHGDDRRMWRHISSTNLALEYIRAWGPVEDVAITHTDYDSVVAAGVLTGRLPADNRLGAAAIAADHTGEENILADPLQAIQDKRDVEYSLSCLQVLLQQGERKLPLEAQKMLQARRTERRRIKALVNSGAFQSCGAGVYAAWLDTRIDGELLPAQLPEATVIVTISPPQQPGAGAVVKTRLGLAAPAGMSLREMKLPGWGGRWNAGSTGRKGGTRDTEAFIATVVRAVNNWR
jgi:hypothetical protein